MCREWFGFATSSDPSCSPPGKGIVAINSSVSPASSACCWSIGSLVPRESYLIAYWHRPHGLNAGKFMKVCMPAGAGSIRFLRGDTSEISSGRTITHLRKCKRPRGGGDHTAPQLNDMIASSCVMVGNLPSSLDVASRTPKSVSGSDCGVLGVRSGIVHADPGHFMRALTSPD